MNLSDENYLLFEQLQRYLNDYSDSIGYKQINIMKDVNIDINQKYKLILIQLLDLDNSYLSFFNYLSIENANKYIENPYYKNITFPNKKIKNWEIKSSSYKPYELFVKNDFIFSNNILYPNLGFFDKPFKYPAVYESNNLWMSITPNEINTMENDINNCYGNVVTFGLGLGYFAYMASLKDSVNEVTIVEINEDVIQLFTKFILPQFKFKDKIKIIKKDAYEFVREGLSNYDYAYVDIYHDAGDGKEVYKKMLEIVKDEDRNKLNFWIYDTIKYYLD